MSSSRSAIEQAGEAVAALHAVDLDALPVADCEAEAVELFRLAARIEAAALARLARFDALGGHGADCAASAAAWLRRELPLDEQDSTARVRHARLLRDLPDTATAYAHGEIPGGHVRVLAQAGKRLGIDVLADYEPILLDLAKTAPPSEVTNAGRPRWTG